MSDLDTLIGHIRQAWTDEHWEGLVSSEVIAAHLIAKGWTAPASHPAEEGDRAS